MQQITKKLAERLQIISSAFGARNSSDLFASDLIVDFVSETALANRASPSDVTRRERRERVVTLVDENRQRVSQRDRDDLSSLVVSRRIIQYDFHRSITQSTSANRDRTMHRTSTPWRTARSRT